jgi:type IV pilus assembly protein PilB
MAFQGAPTQDIRKVAISQGMKTLYRDAISKVLKGVTTLDEVFRVTKRTPDD